MASRIIRTAHARISARLWLSLLSLLLVVVSPLDALSSPHQQQRQEQRQRQGQRSTRTRLGFWTTRESHLSANENANENPRRGFPSLPLRSLGGNRDTAGDNGISSSSDGIRGARNRLWTRLGMKKTEGNGALSEYESIEDDDNDDVFFGNSSSSNDSNAARNKNKLIEIKSEIELPFSAEVAYDAYSDLPRQPSWSSWLESVEVIQSSSSNDNNDDDDDDSKVRSLWTSKMFGIRYSWTAVAVRNERPHTIQWRSVTGLRNEGIVRFRERKIAGNSDNESDGGPTLMTLRMVFVAPRAVSAILKRSKKLSGYVEEKMIAQSLQGFRDIVLENDVKKKQKQKQPTTTTTTAATTTATTTKTKTKTPQ